ncbi:MAG: hypothetical protein ACOYVD_16925 [Bacillota bacterium]
MEEKYILKCNRCFVNNEDIEISHVDTDGNLFCKRCAAYMKKVGGYDLVPFKKEKFIKGLPFVK